MQQMRNCSEQQLLDLSNLMLESSTFAEVKAFLDEAGRQR